MKALTILEPWATLIVEGKKLIETRNWDTDYRGKILIHSSKTQMRDSNYFNYVSCFVDNTDFHRGCIIGEVELYDIIPVTQGLVDVVSKNNYIDLITSEFSTCKYAWLLKNAKIYDKPIPTKGSLGLWDINIEI